MHPQLTRFSGSFLRQLLSFICLFLTLSLAGCSFLDSSSNTHNSTPITSTAGNMTPTTVDQTATATKTSSPTAAPTHSGTTQTTNPASAPIPFKVTGVAFSAWPGGHQGVCRTNTFFTASVIIYAPANTTGGTVTYVWLRSDTNTIATSSVTLAAGTTSRIVTSLWSLSSNQGNGSAYWIALKTLSPEVFITPQITYHHTCQRQVQSISATVSPTLGCTSVTKTFIFSTTVYVSPGPSYVTLTYVWKRSNGTSGTTTTGIVPQSTTTFTLSDSWTLTAPITKGVYWEELSVIAPNNLTSNQSTFNILSC